MFLKTLATGSSGNCHLLDSGKEVLILDCGIPVKQIKKGLNWDISRVVCVCASHAHLDHAKSVKDFENMGIPVFKPYESEMKMQVRTYGGFFIKSFDLEHDGTENRGFFIQTEDNQKILYLTDFEYCRYNFASQKVHHIICECNYQEELVSRDLPQYEHKIKGHCSLETCKNFIKASKTNALRNVILCHMGEDTAIPEECVAEVQKVAGMENVSISVPEKEIELSQYPF